MLQLRDRWQDVLMNSALYQKMSCFLFPVIQFLHPHPITIPSPCLTWCVLSIKMLYLLCSRYNGTHIIENVPLLTCLSILPIMAWGSLWCFYFPFFSKVRLTSMFLFVCIDFCLAMDAILLLSHKSNLLFVNLKLILKKAGILYELVCVYACVYFLISYWIPFDHGIVCL